MQEIKTACKSDINSMLSIFPYGIDGKYCLHLKSLDLLFFLFFY